MIHAFHLAREGAAATVLSDRSAIVDTFRKAERLLWVDLEGADEEDYRLLAEGFGLHPVAVQTCREVTAQPLVHDYDGYLFMVIHAVNFARRKGGVDTLEVDVFWGRHFVVTYHRDPVRTITEIRDQCGGGGGALMSRGADFFVHTLVDRIIDNFTPTFEKIDDLIEEAEEQIFTEPTDAVLQRVMDLKRTVAYLGRTAAAQRDVVGRIVRGEFPDLSQKALVYWRDAYDHLVRMVQTTDVQRDLLAATRDTYLSVVSNRMNEIMKVLTIIATIFIPLTFIAGIYGMNFNPDVSDCNMPELNWAWGYPAVWAAMLAVTLAMLWFFRRRKWI